ncbi:hypothetical protein ANO11243_019320 [Dothideomycetidae sp. 11243]|nr:hypothetical protein ANO11243_019320 [fungal sp. No.11243]
MNSSPPLRPEDGALPQSPAHSEYSIDLNAMTQDTHDEAQSPAPTRRIDEVRSEDIDGPSDFTLNMEDWMRGTHKRKTTAPNNTGTHSRGGTLARGSVRQMYAQTPAEKIHEEDDEDDDAAAQADEDQKHEGDVAPAVVRDSSIWDAYGNPSPSSSPPQIDRRLLQPTVEDYNSDLSLAGGGSPSRPLSAPPMPGRAHEASRLSNVHFPSTPERAQTNGHKDDLDDVRRQLAELRVLHEQTELKAQHFEEQLRSAECARRELRAQLDASSAALSAANAQNEGIVQSELLKSTEEALATARGELDDAKRALGRAKSENVELKTQLDEMRESEDAELQDLRAQLRGKQGLEAELKRQLEDVRGKLGAAESENKSLKAESLAAKEEKREPEVVQEEKGAGNELADAKLEIVHLREELDLLQDLSRLEVDDDDTQPKDTTADTAATAQQMQALQAQLDAAQAELRQARDEAAVSKAALEVLRSERMTSSAEGDRSAGEEQLRLSERKRLELHSLLEELRDELDGLRTANAEMDARVASALGRREERWLAKQLEWERERKIMAKALLRQWGREECGIETREEQKYRYRYARGLTTGS